MVSDESTPIVSTDSAIITKISPLAEKLESHFTNVKIKKSDLDAAERKIRGELIQNWKERVRPFLKTYLFKEKQ